MCCRQAGTRFPFLFRANLNRHAMTGSRLGCYNERQCSPRVPVGWGPGLLVRKHGS
jgi:hypothetical protein